MDKNHQNAIKTNEANMEIDEIFNGEDQPLGSWPKNASPNEAENANMNMDLIFNKDQEDDFDMLADSAYLTRGTWIKP